MLMPNGLNATDISHILEDENDRDFKHVPYSIDK